MARVPAEKVATKPVRWIGSSKEDLSAFPVEVKGRVGQALWKAQTGSKASFAKPLRGFGGAGVLEVVDDFDGEAYRAVYTVSFADVVYVLHAFHKKSRKGIETPKSEVDLIKARLIRAREDYAQWRKSQRSQ